MQQRLVPSSTVTQIEKANNFGLIRYLLAISILLSHIADLAGQDVFWPVSPTTGVKGFFIISGFLVGLSYLKSATLSDFFDRRLRRLMPGYFGVIGFCLFIGFLMTNLPLTTFITDPQTFKYLLANLLTLNFIEPALPGVFDENILPALNGSLWTTKVEILLYMTVPLILFACKKWNKGWVLLAAYVLSCLYSEACDYLYASTGRSIFEIMNRQGFGQIRYFYAGTFLLFYFNQFTRKATIYVPIAVAILLLNNHIPAVRFLEPAAFAIVVISAAYLLPYCPILQRHDNIAYGIYLYHFPVIQTFVALGLYQIHFGGAILLTIATTIILAIISWNLIEKRFLFKKKFVLATTSSDT